MVPFRAWQILFLTAVLAAPPAFAARTHRSATSGHTTHDRRHVRHTRFVPGQRHIDPDRAREIQDALIREHYLTPPASGEWDANTEAAMQKYQADHGWQTKLTPDSRALIKLGLGPSNDTLSPAPAATGAVTSENSAPSTAGVTAANGTLAQATTDQN